MTLDTGETPTGDDMDWFKSIASAPGRNTERHVRTKSAATFTECSACGNLVDQGNADEDDRCPSCRGQHELPPVWQEEELEYS
jgi:rubrerythrin